MIPMLLKRADDTNTRVTWVTIKSERDLAISYIQQVRQTEKELLKKVESFFNEEAVHFINNRDWLQENAEGLQSACNLADIVMSDRGVEMLLLKKEMEEKCFNVPNETVPGINLTICG
jgi:hypothetical protein